MMLADQEDWDRYTAVQWLNMRRWLDENPDDELAPEVRAELTAAPARYTRYLREYLGWGVFVLMQRDGTADTLTVVASDQDSLAAAFDGQTTGIVRMWNDDDGWGVIDSPHIPGGCWAHSRVTPTVDGRFAVEIVRTV